MENDITTLVQEVDVAGGWLVTHYTHTWDQRTPLVQIADELIRAKKLRDAAQEHVDTVAASVAEFQAKIADAKAGGKPVDATLDAAAALL